LLASEDADCVNPFDGWEWTRGIDKDVDEKCAQGCDVMNCRSALCRSPAVCSLPEGFCPEENDESLLQDDGRQTGADELVALLHDSQAESSNAQAGWNCG
jgi:hypothetical protein